jgi:hypothetical protein
MSPAAVTGRCRNHHSDDDEAQAVKPKYDGFFVNAGDLKTTKVSAAAADTPQPTKPKKRLKPTPNANQITVMPPPPERSDDDGAKRRSPRSFIGASLVAHLSCTLVSLSSALGRAQASVAVDGRGGARVEAAGGVQQARDRARARQLQVKDVQSLSGRLAGASARVRQNHSTAVRLRWRAVE